MPLFSAATPKLSNRRKIVKPPSKEDGWFNRSQIYHRGVSLFSSYPSKRQPPGRSRSSPLLQTTPEELSSGLDNFFNVKENETPVYTGNHRARPGIGATKSSSDLCGALLCVTPTGDPRYFVINDSNTNRSILDPCSQSNSIQSMCNAHTVCTPSNSSVGTSKLTSKLKTSDKIEESRFPSADSTPVQPRRRGRSRTQRSRPPPPMHTKSMPSQSVERGLPRQTLPPSVKKEKVRSGQSYLQFNPSPSDNRESATIRSSNDSFRRKAPLKSKSAVSFHAKTEEQTERIRQLLTRGRHCQLQREPSPPTITFRHTATPTLRGVRSSGRPPKPPAYRYMRDEVEI